MRIEKRGEREEERGEKKLIATIIDGVPGQKNDVVAVVVVGDPAVETDGGRG